MTKTKRSTSPSVVPIDVHELQPRLLLEVSDLLTDVRQSRAEFSIRERIATLSMLHRIIYAWIKGEDGESESAGSAVRKYAAAFSAPAHGGTGGKVRGGRSRDRDADDWDADEPGD